MAVRQGLFVVALVIAGICGYAQAQLAGGEAYKALSLKGGAWVEVDAIASQLAGKEFSFEAWIKINQSDLGETGPLRPIFSRYNTQIEAPGDEENDFLLALNNQGKVIFLAGGSTELGFVMVSNTTVLADTWYHIAFAIKYSDILSAFPYQAFLYVDRYVNGELQRETKNAFWIGPGYSRTVLTSEKFVIGRYFNYAGPTYFVGVVDEVRIWQGRRSGADITNFAFRTVAHPGQDEWALSTAEGGSSANLLVASYNFNSGSETVVTDQSGNGAHGEIKTAPAGTEPGNETPAGEVEIVGNDNTPMVTYVYAIGSIPLEIPLMGLDSRDIDRIGMEYKIIINSDLAGSLYQYDRLNKGAGNNPYPVYLEVPVPGIGAKIDNGTVVAADSIVYVHTPTSRNIGRFYYEVVDGDLISQRVEVRIMISCVGDSDAIDLCGVCNGMESARDVCGICFGDSTDCQGCDGIPWSNTTYDECWVCGGNSTTCLGCDGEPNSGMEYDPCGICGGKNDSCYGCDGLNGTYDICGVCNGNGETCHGCDGVPGSGKEYDPCGVCDGKNDTCYTGCDNGKWSNKVNDICGVCGGDGSSCLGCDGIYFSGLDYDNCGVCGGNGSTCAGCDGSGGGVVDICGVCRGDGSTCGGCDGKGGEYDHCGVCGGDNSACTCVYYHGYHVQELDYVLLQWALQHSIADLDKAIAYLDKSLHLLTDYRGDLDLAAVVLYLNDFQNKTGEYEKIVDQFTRELDISLGNIYIDKNETWKWQEDGKWESLFPSTQQ